jgi:lycopene cyclase domain-containing protein
MLTGTGLQQAVVWYNPKSIIGARVASIPVEDFFYGADLLLMNLLIFYRIEKKTLL